MDYRQKYIVILLFVFVGPFQLFTLKAADTTSWFTGVIDTNYLEDLSHNLTLRVYSSRKYSTYGIMDFNIEEKLQYNPNSRLILGLGFSYGILSINVGVNFPALNNKDTEQLGNTRHLDLQTHIYSRKFVIDLYFMKYEGFYLQNSHDMITDWPSHDTHQLRGDMKLNGYGANVQYIFNNRKFSYRAAYAQTDRQKKSAGSFLAGIDCYYTVGQGDSSLIPTNIKYPYFWLGMRYDKSTNFSFGLNGGYAHTFVIKEKWFLSLSAVPGLSVGKATLSYAKTDQNMASFSVNANLMWRFAIGYHSPNFFVGFSYVNLRLRNQAPPLEAWLNFDTGILRFTVAKHIKLKKPIKFLEPWKYYF